MTDLSFEDLVESGSGAASSSAASTAKEAAEEAGKPLGDFLLEVVDRLDERDLLEPILFGPEGLDELEAARDRGGGGGGADAAQALDADTLAKMGKQVIDQLGDVKISKLVMIAEERPELVDQLLEENL